MLRVQPHALTILKFDVDNALMGAQNNSVGDATEYLWDSKGLRQKIW